MELAPGPVEMRPDVLSLGACQPGYFRTDQFSAWMLALKEKFGRTLGLRAGHDIIFLTGSGTAGMEAVAANFLPAREHLAISSGQFGERMCDIARRRRFRFDRVEIDLTRSATANLLDFDLARYRSCCATICETSNGYYLDPRAIRAAGLADDSLLLCDGISSAFVDDFDANQADVLVIGSQKGLGLAPGMCFIVLSEKAVDTLRGRKECGSLYYDFNLYIDNMKRGQIPFTPSLTILYQLDRTLDNLAAAGGLGVATAFRAALAQHFRMRLTDHGIPYTSAYVSNCVTVIHTGTIDAELIAKHLHQKYNIVVATNAPPYKKTRFRVSHMGNNSLGDMDQAADAICSTMRELS